MADMSPVTMHTGFSQALGSTQIHPWSRPLRAPNKDTSSGARTPGVGPLTTQDIVTLTCPLTHSKHWEFRDELDRV